MQGNADLFPQVLQKVLFIFSAFACLIADFPVKDIDHVPEQRHGAEKTLPGGMGQKRKQFICVGLYGFFRNMDPEIIRPACFHLPLRKICDKRFRIRIISYRLRILYSIFVILLTVFPGK